MPCKELNGCRGFADRALVAACLSLREEIQLTVTERHHDELFVTEEDAQQKVFPGISQNQEGSVFVNAPINMNVIEQKSVSFSI